jgi:hypothetical protein
MKKEISEKSQIDQNLEDKDVSLFSINHEKRIQELEDILKCFVNWKTDKDGNKSILDDDELWDRSEKILQ